MSNAKHADATLEGYDGPHFPSQADDLGRLLDKGTFNGAWLSKVGATIDGFTGRGHETTSDGYTWFSAVAFSRGSGTVAILIPWLQDWDRTDDSQNDRAVAVHTNNVDEDTAAAVVSEFIAAFKRQQEIDAIAAEAALDAE